MTHDSEWRHFRKTLLGVALIAAPVLMFASDVATSGIYDGNDERRYLAAIADNEGLYYAGNLLGAIGALFVVGAVVALIHLVRVRHPGFAKVAGGIALVGAITMSGVWLTFTLVELELARSSDRAAMAAVIASSEDSAAMAPLFVTWIGISLGLLLLAAGLWRARTVPRWMAALLAGSVVVLFFGEGALSIVASVLMAGALIPIGVLVLRSSVEAWEAGDLAVPPQDMTADSSAVATP
jgi:hypothetical protein